MEIMSKDKENIQTSESSVINHQSSIPLRPIPYLPHTNEDRKEMLDFLKVGFIEDLLKPVPKKLRNFELKIPKGKSEIEILEEFTKLGDKNLPVSKQISFCGGGVYYRFVPSVVHEIISKGEFYTAYTPYQPEVSQGTLQAIYEFQTAICNLTGMDVANASLYDGATAVTEAALMACRITKRKKILVSGSLNPEASSVCATYAWGANLELIFVEQENGITSLASLEKLIDNDTACLVISSPNFNGCIEPVSEISALVHAKGAMLICGVGLISLSVLKTPRELGVDIAVGDGQELGNSLNYGGPHVGFISSLKTNVRQIPGRLVGLTKDVNGKRAFTLTLQTREQHIRREHATSNICTNQSLNALAVLVYLTYMGYYGLRKISEISINNAHFLAHELEEVNFRVSGIIKTCKLAYKTPFFNEFLLDLPIAAKEFIDKLAVKNILPGLDLNSIRGYKTNQILMATTEMNTTEQINYFIKCVKEIFS